MANATLFLTSAIQVLLFNKEITGQLSDGYWENSAPFEHWKFWSCVGASFAVGHQPGIEISTAMYVRCNRNNYGLERLLKFDEPRERMLALGRSIDPSYTEKQLRADLKVIKMAMRTVRYV